MKTILHVDDNEEIRLLLEAIIKRHGYTYIGMSRAEEALEVLKKDSVDLVLLDLHLAGKMQGVDLINNLEKLKIRKKIIPLTASPTLIKRLKKEHPELVVECILKPFEPEKLLIQIKKAIG